LYLLAYHASFFSQTYLIFQYKIFRPDGLSGAYAQIAKETISFFRSIRLSVRMCQYGSHGKDFREICYWEQNENLSKNSTFG